MMNISRVLAQIQIDPEIPKNTISQGSVTSLLQIFFAILAAVAVLIVTISSLLFVLSRGNPEKAARARNAIIYALVGLAVALAAEAIVTFVVGNV